MPANRKIKKQTKSRIERLEEETKIGPPPWKGKKRKPKQ